MNRRLFLTLKATLLTLFISSNVFAQSDSKAASAMPQVLMETSAGTVVLELYPEKAPKTVENFLKYVNEGFYDGTIFHRVIPNFMIQGGGFTKDFQKKITHAPIQNEADNGLRNRIGTIAMARTNDPQSATAQFFINVAQNTGLDHREKSSSQAWGYAVFGKVTSGMKTVNKIRRAQTGFKNGMKNVPIKTVKIIKVRQIK